MSTLPSLTETAKQRLDEHLEGSFRSRKYPAIFFGVSNAKDVIYYNQVGYRDFGAQDPGGVNAETVVELFSQTKFIASLGALLLVDRGGITLDSTADIERYLPEVSQAKVLRGYAENGAPILSRLTRQITLRMLMSHTAGYVYVNGDPEKWLASHPEQNPKPGFLLDPKASVASLCTPLGYEPGTSWRYSHSPDWVGVLCERISGLSFEAYLRKYLFEPCDASSLTFYPSEAVKARKMTTCTRDQYGEVVALPTGFGLDRPTDEADVRKGLLSGGSGLFGSLKDYLAILRGVLASDPQSNRGPSPLLSPTSYYELFQPSIPDLGESDGAARLAEQYSRHYNPSYPSLNGSEVNHSVGGLINLQNWPSRRSAYSVSWAGAAKTQFWLDPTSGIAAVCGTQLICSDPDPWYDVYAEFEKLVYEGVTGSH